jgi:hypothetical protein
MRERGGSFTFIALALAMLVLISAGLLVDASRNTLILSAQEGRQSALREAAFSGACWAAVSLESGVDQPGGVVEFMGCQVEVRPLAATPKEAKVRCAASNALGESFVIEAILRAGSKKAGEDAWRLTGYTRVRAAK